jgi:hypothetical protein
MPPQQRTVPLPLGARLPRLLLVLAARLGAVDAWCQCPAGVAACGVGDLVVTGDVAAGESWIGESCVPDAAGHVVGNIVVQNNAAVASVDFSAMVSCNSIQVYNNTALASLDLSNLNSAGWFINVYANAALASLDLRRLVSVTDAYTVANNNAAIVTALPCAAKAIPKLIPSGAVTYWNEHPTVCHAGSATLGDDGTCGECAEYAGGGACGGVSACVSCSITGAPALLPGFVQFVPGSVQIDSPGAHIFECDSKFGCHGTTATGAGASCVSDRYEGHFCASCVGGFRHVKAEGEYEYECVECETANLLASTLVLAAVVPTAGGMTLLWRKYNPATEAKTLALQAVMRSVWLPIRCIITYAQVNSHLGDVLDVRFPAEYAEIMERLGSVLSVSDLLVGSECAGLSSFFNKWLKDVVIQPCIMLGVVAMYCNYERRASGRETAIKHATGNAFFVIFFCCECLNFRQRLITFR